MRTHQMPLKRLMLCGVNFTSVKPTNKKLLSRLPLTPHCAVLAAGSCSWKKVREAVRGRVQKPSYQSVNPRQGSCGLTDNCTGLEASASLTPKGRDDRGMGVEGEGRIGGGDARFQTTGSHQLHGQGPVPLRLASRQERRVVLLQFAEAGSGRGSRFLGVTWPASGPAPESVLSALATHPEPRGRDP